MRSVDLQTIKEYACEDADITLQLKPLLDKELVGGQCKKTLRRGGDAVAKGVD